MLRNAIVRG
ncbi:hypothetical protein N499_0527A, partial [Wolbachia pipientis wVitA]